MQAILAIIVALGISLAVVVSRNAPSPPVSQTPASIEVVTSHANVAATNTNINSGTNVSLTPEIHPVSIPALIAMQPDGHDLKLGKVLADNASYTRYFVTFESGQLTISGIMNIPKGRGPFPVLVLNHGYIDPKIYTNGRGLKREQDYFARQGFAVLHPDYRCHAQSDCDGSDEFTLRLGYVKDVINAVQAIKTSTDTRLNTKQIGMLGHSMGGGIAWNIMVAKPDLVEAFVLFAPVSADLRDNFEKWTTRRPAEAKQIISLYGTAEQQPEFWDNLSPQEFFSRIAEPVMLHHGTADESVPLEWSEASVADLKGLGKDITFHTYNGQPHEFTSSWGTVMQRTTEFFKKHVSQ